MSKLSSKQAINVITNNQLSNQNSTQVTDGVYLVEKINDKVRVLWRTKKGEKCTEVKTEQDVIPKGAQSFSFAMCKVFSTDYDNSLELMVPETFINAPTKSVFKMVSSGGFATFSDQKMKEEQVSSFLADEVKA